MTQNHGGDLDAAMARYGGAARDWIDLSTGINRRPYPMPDFPADLWSTLPTADLFQNALAAARAAYGAEDIAGVAVSGAQAAIQLLPSALPPGRAAILTPTYSEHARAFRNADWTVTEQTSLQDIRSAAAAIVVNPNNPDGQQFAPAELHALADTVGTLVVDESFADATPKTSLLGRQMPPNAVVLRSFGKFFGLAGLRLGFVFGPQRTIERLSDCAGPWAVSGPALVAGTRALQDIAWQRATRKRLTAEARRLDGLAAKAGLSLVGGTALFRTYATPDAAAAQQRLAEHRIWSRVFDYQPEWLRLGLPGSDAEWERLSASLTTLAARPEVAPAR